MCSSGGIMLGQRRRRSLDAITLDFLSSLH